MEPTLSNVTKEDIAFLAPNNIGHIDPKYLNDNVRLEDKSNLQLLMRVYKKLIPDLNIENFSDVLSKVFQGVFKVSCSFKNKDKGDGIMSIKIFRGTEQLAECYVPQVGAKAYKSTVAFYLISKKMPILLKMLVNYHRAKRKADQSENKQNSNTNNFNPLFNSAQKNINHIYTKPNNFAPMYTQPTNQNNFLSGTTQEEETHENRGLLRQQENQISSLVIGDTRQNNQQQHLPLVQPINNIREVNKLIPDMADDPQTVFDSTLEMITQNSNVSIINSKTGIYIKELKISKRYLKEAILKNEEEFVDLFKGMMKDVYQKEIDFKTQHNNGLYNISIKDQISKNLIITAKISAGHIEKAKKAVCLICWYHHFGFSFKTLAKYLKAQKDGLLMKADVGEDYETLNELPPEVLEFYTYNFHSLKTRLKGSSSDFDDDTDFDHLSLIMKSKGCSLQMSVIKAEDYVIKFVITPFENKNDESQCRFKVKTDDFNKAFALTQKVFKDFLFEEEESNTALRTRENRKIEDQLELRHGYKIDHYTKMNEIKTRIFDRKQFFDPTFIDGILSTLDFYQIIKKIDILSNLRLYHNKLGNMLEDSFKVDVCREDIRWFSFTLIESQATDQYMQIISLKILEIEYNDIYQKIYERFK